MLSDRMFFVFAGLVVISLAVGNYVEPLKGWLIFGGGLITMGIADFISNRIFLKD